MVYTKEQAQITLNMEASGASKAAIARALGKKVETVKAHIKRRNYLATLPEKTVVRKSVMSGRVGLLTKKAVLGNSTISVRDIPALLVDKLGPDFVPPSKSTIHRYLQDARLAYVFLPKKPFIAPRNVDKRYQFAQNILSSDAGREEINERILWSDETTVRKCPQGKQLRFWVHSNTLKEDLPSNFQIQQGGFSVMFWGCFSDLGVGPLVALEGSQNQDTYLELLRDYVIPELLVAREQYGTVLTFMQDNAPCHKANRVTEFLADSGIKVIDWPPQSPDLNPIENLWAWVKQKRAKKFGLPDSRMALIEQVLEIWEQIPPEFLKNYARSATTRLEEVVRRGGQVTKY